MKKTAEEPKFVCPNGCDWERVADYLFYAHTLSGPQEGPEGTRTRWEIPPYVDADGKLTNRWTDGIIGISKEDREWWESCDDLPHCVVCHYEAVWSP